ncbi:hypothetical protein SAMN06309944_0110 [Micrococcales bacterium KH10]|nr:hypothetical protein SAMN06309944_0110 [Micrococcales bacterium KH10]
MSDSWLAITYVAIFAVIGGVVSVWLLARARKTQLQQTAENAEQYRAALASQSATNERLAKELAGINERLAAVEKLLRDVG